MDRTVTSRDGTSLAYTRSGRGPAIVLVSGAMSTGATTAPLAARLAERCEVVVYDRRGRGGSGDTEPYAVAREVEDLGALIGEVGGSAALYGVSSVAHSPWRRRRAAWRGVPGRRYEPPFALSEEDARARQRYTERLTEALRRGARGDAVELFLSLSPDSPPR